MSCGTCSPAAGCRWPASGRWCWEGIKAAIPTALIALLVEKLVSLLMPAAGAVLLIIQGLQAAWGAAGRILQAFEKFFTFLRAVKTGRAGAQFAAAVAAAAIAVLDFLSNFLLARLARGASRVGQRLRSIAQRIGQRLRRVVSGIGRRLGRVGRRIGARLRRLGGRGRQKTHRRGRSDTTNGSHALAALRPRVGAMLRRGVRSFALRCSSRRGACGIGCDSCRHGNKGELSS